VGVLLAAKSCPYQLLSGENMGTLSAFPQPVPVIAANMGGSGPEV